MIWGMVHVELSVRMAEKVCAAIDAEKHRRIALSRNRRERSNAIVDAFRDKTFALLGVERRQMATIERYFDFHSNPPSLIVPPLPE